MLETKVVDTNAMASDSKIVQEALRQCAQENDINGMLVIIGDIARRKGMTHFVKSLGI